MSYKEVSDPTNHYETVTSNPGGHNVVSAKASTSSFGNTTRSHQHVNDEIEQIGLRKEKSDSFDDDDSDPRVRNKKYHGRIHDDGRRELTEKECYKYLGYSFPWYKKWMILTVIFLVQLSMNFNTSVYPNAIPLISEDYHISEQAARCSQMIFLIAYAFGCELWAPWSEEFGRKPILQASLFLVNIWQILGGLAPNFGGVMMARFLGGLSSAGGSVTLGMVADLYEPNIQGFGVAFIVLSSVGGSAIGPPFGGLLQRYAHWRWNFWTQLIFGGVVQVMHLLLVSETRSSILVDRQAKLLRESGEDENIYGPNEIHGRHISFKEVLKIWSRPFEMFLREPIVLCLSLLSGFSDALIFVCMESFTPVYKQWGFGIVGCGLAFVPVIIGYLIAYAIHLPDIYRQIKIFKHQGEEARLAERRLLLLLFIAPLEAIGLFGFAWTSMGPAHNPWIAPMIFTCLIAIANYSIYMSTIDYMIAAYGPYSASATGGNGFARDFLAGVSTMYATPMYMNIGGKLHLQWASTLLGCLAILVAIPIYIFYWKGPAIRHKSKFAQTLAADRQVLDLENENIRKAPAVEHKEVA